MVAAAASGHQPLLPAHSSLSHGSGAKLRRVSTSAAACATLMPAARHLIESQGLDAAAIAASGPGNRVGLRRVWVFVVYFLLTSGNFSKIVTTLTSSLLQVLKVDVLSFLGSVKSVAALPDANPHVHKGGGGAAAAATAATATTATAPQPSTQPAATPTATPTATTAASSSSPPPPRGPYQDEKPSQVNGVHFMSCHIARAFALLHPPPLHYHHPPPPPHLPFFCVSLHTLYVRQVGFTHAPNTPCAAACPTSFIVHQ